MTDVPTIQFDLSQLLVTRALVQGTSGAGKSHMLRYMLEQTHGQVQQIVIDREGEFATLREKFPYLLVGADGDIPADPRAAKLLPRKLLELRVSALIDLSELNLDQQRRFVADFCGTMAHLPRRYWTDCLVVIDEAHLFAPENGKSESTKALADLASLGRKRGYCQILATSRLAKLSKDASSECLNKLIGRTSSDDMKRALEELGSRTTDRTTLRSLEPGQFYAYGPAISVDPVLVRSGATQTAPPPRGAARPPSPPAPKAIQKILGELADLPQQADAEARSVADLQARIATLTRDLRRAEKVAPVAEPRVVEKVVERIVERPVVSPAELATIDKTLVRCEKQMTALSELTAAVAALRATVMERTADRPIAPPRRVQAPTIARAVIPRAIGTPRPQGAQGSLPEGERKVLTVICQYPDGATREQITVITGYKRSTRDTYIQRLTNRSLVTVKGATIFPTDDSFAALGDFRPLPTGLALREHWLATLPAGEGAVLGVLVDAYPSSVSRDRITEVTDYKRSTRDTYLQRLISRRLVDTSRGEPIASATLFSDDDA